MPNIAVSQTEDDLRPISLTPFFSKVTEHFVVEWLLDFIGPKIDFRQYGGLKGNSITHYIIEFINFVLSCQDNNDQTAVLACFVDFQNAFMRRNLVRFARHGINEVCGVKCKSSVFYGTELSNP